MSRPTFAAKLLLSSLAACALLAAVARAATEPAPYKKSPGPFAVETALFDWTDAARNRQVPVKIYFPRTGDGPFPVIIFSHGMGGSREGYEYLGRHWASHGYISVHVQHNTGDNVTRESMTGDAQPAGPTARPLDIRFTIDRLEQLNREESPLKGRLDLNRIGMAGHSKGAGTTLTVIGEIFTLAGGRGMSLPDPRIEAAVVMSPAIPVNLLPPSRQAERDKAFGSIKVPCFFMTGTLDDSPIGQANAKAADRRIPFDHMNALVDRYLVIFQGGTHFIFAGREGQGRPLFHDLILQGATAFWDAYLKDDPAAKAWLADGYQAVLGANAAAYEKKLSPRPEADKPPAAPPPASPAAK